MNKFSGLIDAANTEQVWFTKSTSSLRSEWPRYPLNLGVTNNFSAIDKSGDRTCTDPNIIFQAQREYGFSDASSNFWSCVFYPNMTRDYRDPTLMTPRNRRIVSELNVDTRVETARSVTSFIAECLLAHCQNNENCVTPSCSREMLLLNGSTMLSAAEVRNCYTTICEHDPEMIANPDITGIGVLTSYIVQYIIAVTSVFWLVLASLQRIRDKKIINRARDTLLTTLDEFQRTQCCFIIAVDLATLSTFDGMTHADFVDAGTATNAALLPTILVLALLMWFNVLEHSSFTFWLTFATWIISFGVSLDPRSEPASSHPAACGHIPPRYICEHDKGINGGWAPLVFLAPTMIFLIFWHLRSRYNNNGQLAHLRLLLSEICLRMILPLRRWWRRRGIALKDQCRPLFQSVASITPSTAIKLCSITLRLFLAPFSILVWLILALLWYVGTMITILIIPATLGVAAFISIAVHQNLWTKLEDREWTFGQVIAVTIWMPTALSFLNDCFYGVLTGRSNQLPRRMTVVRSTLQEEDFVETMVAIPRDHEKGLGSTFRVRHGATRSVDIADVGESSQIPDHDKSAIGKFIAFPQWLSALLASIRDFILQR